MIPSRLKSSAVAYWACVAAIVLTSGTLQLHSSLQDSQTHDEAVHLVAGYSYWKTGDFRLNPEHPPVSKLLSALPLLWMQPEFAPSAEAWNHPDQWSIGKAFLYSNRIHADRILLAGRLPTMLSSLAISISLAFWVSRRAGYLAGVISVLMFAFEPTVLAHSRYVTSDIPVTLFIWLSFASGCAYLEGGGNWAIIRTGLMTGLAISTKFSALFLPLSLVFILKLYKKSRWSAALLFLGSMILVVLMAYRFDTRSTTQDPGLTDQMAPQLETAQGIKRALIELPVPGYYFLRGIHLLLRHEVAGHLTYFWGSTGKRSAWFYFPVAFLIKSSLSWLALLGMAFLFKIIYKHHQTFSVGLLVLPAIYAAIAIAGTINIGIRHLLPIYPFICAYAAVFLAKSFNSSRNRICIVVLLLGFVIESAIAHPYYVSYFNVAAGGAKQGHRYLLDSNLDWGQDLKRLSSYVKAQNFENLCLAYFGTAEPRYYSINSQPLPPLDSSDDLVDLDCTVAISVQYLYGMERPFAPLRRITPTAIVGTSIHIYRVRESGGYNK